MECELYLPMQILWQVSPCGAMIKQLQTLQVYQYKHGQSEIASFQYTTTGRREEKKKAAGKTTMCIIIDYDNQLPTIVARRRDHLLWNPVTFAINTLQITWSPTLAACMRSSTSAQLAEQYHQLWKNQLDTIQCIINSNSPLPAHPFSWLWEEKTFSIRWCFFLLLCHLINNNLIMKCRM